MPFTIESLGANPPDALGSTPTGKAVWATLFSFVALFPVSLPRELTALRFSSLFSFALSIMVVLTVIVVCFVEDSSDYDLPLGDRFSIANEKSQVSVVGVFNSLPLIIFSYMYQPNVPALYQELKKRNMTNMNKVLYGGTAVAATAYIMTGMFGYVTFAAFPEDQLADIMDEQNILKAPYHENRKIIKVCQVSMLIVVLFASPFTVLPAKDSFEELITKGKRSFSQKENVLVTFCIVTFAWGVALLVPSIGDAMTILGATTNSWIGFVLPVVFYFKVLEKKGRKRGLTNMVLGSYFIVAFIMVSSVITLYSFIHKKLYPDE
jgi:amino acid permease